MRIAPFELERWQSIWENRVAINISESGVDPLSVTELVGNPDQLPKLLSAPLGYPQTNGCEALRSHIASLYPAATAANVLVTCGCSEANFIVTWALLEPGDEVILMQPNYMQIAGVAGSFGTSIKPLWLREELRWAPDLDELRRLVSKRTRLIAICNPNNPTGAVLSPSAMQEICSAAASVGAYVLADEVYRGAEFGPPDAPLTRSFWGAYERVLCTSGLSKAYGLPGLRTGWIVGPEDLVEKLWGYHDYTSIAPTMLSDRLATIALEPSRRKQILERTRAIIRRNYPVVQRWLQGHRDHLTHIPPSAGAIAWVGHRFGWKSDQWVEQLRHEKGVLLVPGSQFEMDDYLRIGFGGDPLVLQQGLELVDELLRQHLSVASE